MGNPVPGVNIDASGGPTVTNGGTDINGLFTTTITPDGVYDILFEPPGGALLVTTAVEDVVVTGVVNMGDVVLPPGANLTGRVLRAADSQPVVNANLDIVVDGNELPIPNDQTDSMGQFALIVPFGSLSLQIRTESLPAPVLAPQELDLDIMGNTDLGDLFLQPGFFLSAIVQRQSNGSPVVNADIDVIDSATNVKLFTPGDNTDSAGFVDVVVPVGTYDFEVCPIFANQLVATTLSDQVVAGTTLLGTISLANGVVLSGTVTDGGGIPQTGIDVDVSDSATGIEVTLCADNTDGNGNYAVVVPLGTFDVEFDPPLGHPACTQVVLGVVVNGNTTVNATLPQSPIVYCTSKASSVPGCIPSISAPSCSASPDGRRRIHRHPVRPGPGRPPARHPRLHHPGQPAHAAQHALRLPVPADRLRLLPGDAAGAARGNRGDLLGGVHLRLRHLPGLAQPRSQPGPGRDDRRPGLVPRPEQPGRRQPVQRDALPARAVRRR